MAENMARCSRRKTLPEEDKKGRVKDVKEEGFRHDLGLRS